MTTPRTVIYEYPSDADTVATLLRDPTFLRSRCEAAGENNVEVTIEETAQGLRVVVSRDKDVALPAFAKRMFQSANRIVDDTMWSRRNGRWVADYAIEIQGIPGEVRGHSELVPSATGCRYESSFEVTARVPLLGAKIEGFLADRVEEGLRANARRNADQLRS